MSTYSLTSMDPDNLINYLIQKHLIDMKSIVEDKIIIRDVSRLNHNIQVLQENGIGYFLKQPSRTNEYSNKFVKKEAKFYSVMFSDKKFEDIQMMLPNFIKYERKNNVLIIEFLKNMTHLSEIQLNPTQQIECFETIGKYLAIYHNKFHKYLHHNSFRFLEKSLPLTFFLSRPRPEIFSVISNGALELLKTIQQKPGMAKFLEDIPDKWNPTTMIHGDMRMDNILVSTNPKNLKNIKVIDWELSSIGDPIWDVAGLVSDLVLQQFYLLISEGEMDGYSYESQLRLLTRKVNPLSKRFLKIYYKNLDKKRLKEDQFEIKLLKFCIAKIIQTAFNSLQYSDTITSIAEDIIQISSQMILNQDQTITHILER